MKNLAIKPRPITAKFEIVLVSHEINGATFNVNLRELHTKLKNGELFATWIKARIEKYEFLENKDFIVFWQKPKNSQGGRQSKEYIGTLNMAKELAMVENSVIGKIARQYFIKCEEDLKKVIQQSQHPYMPRGYPQMLEAARNDWKQVRKELIQTISDFLGVHDRKRKSQFTDKIYIDLIEARARELREYFDLRFPYQLTRDYLHQLVQEAVCEVEIRMTDAINTGTINSWEDFKEILDIFTEQARRLKELQNGRIPLPSYALPQHTAMVRH